ncbi:LAP1 [Scenedesmus sp. PABB004]|nr:LAP1 [Scenedesmus sp. PABB004]
MQPMFEPASLPEVSVGPAGGAAERAGAPDQHALRCVLVSEAQLAAGDHVGALDTPGQQRALLDAAVAMHRFKAAQGEALPPVLLPDPSDGDAPPRGLMLLGLGKAPSSPAAWGQSAFHVRCPRRAPRGQRAARAPRSRAAPASRAGEPRPSAPQAAGAALAGAAKAFGPARVEVTWLDARAASGAAVTSFVASALAGLYEGDVRFRSKPQPKIKLEAIRLAVAAEGDAEASHGELLAAARRGAALARGALVTRLLAEAPANVCTPRYLAAAAAHIAALDPARFRIKVLEEPAVRALGMGLFLGVAAGSDEPPRLIHLTYLGQAAAAPHRVALVGKSVCFDSGGYNLKTAGGIETMKVDMAGGAAVLGAARALAELRPAGVEVHFILAACENLVSGRATRPSDIHVSAAGKTVEVFDTDAEGRLTLADALWYAQSEAGATTVVDIATLTGAAGVALGQSTGALFAADDGLAAHVDAASRRAGEKLWRLPLDEGLRKKIESPIADLKNYAGRWGGAITAALFLQEFITEGTAWAHLDVAGPAWDDAACLPTGFGAATLTELVMGLAEGQSS